MRQSEFTEKTKENWSARLRKLYRDKFEFVPGQISVQPLTNVYVGQIVTLEVNIGVPFPMELGGQIRLQLNNSLGANWAFDVLQKEDPGDEGYVALDEVSISKGELQLPRPGIIIINVTDRMQQGDLVKIVIGDSAHGSQGARLKEYTQTIGFYVSVKADKSSEWYLFDNVPEIEVLALPAQTCKLVIPSTTPPDGTLTAKKVNFDIFGNPSGEKGVYLRDYKINRPTAKQWRVYSKQDNLTIRSNPSIAKQDQDNLYWGEIHGHTYLSDGLESPEYFYEYARDVELLDFCSITDHDSWLDNRKWEYIRRVNNTFYEVGKFVTLLGFEWSSDQWPHSQRRPFGHKCVYYPSLEGDYYSHLIAKYDNPEKLFEVMNKYDAFAVAHHPAYADRPDCVWGTDWSHHSEAHQPLVEIYSKHGLSEAYGNRWPLFCQEPSRFVQSALAKGYKLGFVAGSDTHISRPASDMKECRRGIRYPKSGLTAVWAEKLTRDCIFSALKNRQCYATTGERIVVSFSIAEKQMGSIIPRCLLSNSDKVDMHILVAGTDRLESVEIIGNNQIIFSQKPDKTFIEFDFIGNLPNEPSFYYVRVIQVDGNMAWSSPVWILPNSNVLEMTPD